MCKSDRSVSLDTSTKAVYPIFPEQFAFGLSEDSFSDSSPILDFPILKKIKFCGNQHDGSKHAFVKDAPTLQVFPFNQLGDMAANGFFNNQVRQIRLVQSIDSKVYFTLEGAPGNDICSHAQAAMLPSVDDPNRLVSNHYAMNGADANITFHTEVIDGVNHTSVLITEMSNQTGAFKTPFYQMQLLLISLLDEMIKMSTKVNTVYFADQITFHVAAFYELPQNERPSHHRFITNLDTLISKISLLKSIYQYTLLSPASITKYVKKYRVPTFYFEVENSVEHNKLVRSAKINRYIKRRPSDPGSSSDEAEKENKTPTRTPKKSASSSTSDMLKFVQQTSTPFSMSSSNNKTPEQTRKPIYKMPDTPIKIIMDEDEQDSSPTQKRLRHSLPAPAALKTPQINKKNKYNPSRQDGIHGLIKLSLAQEAEKNMEVKEGLNRLFQPKPDIEQDALPKELERDNDTPMNIPAPTIVFGKSS